MTTVRAKSGEREVHFSVELEFLRDDTESSGTLFVTLSIVTALDNLVNNGIIHILDTVGYLVISYCDLVIAWLGIFPAVTLIKSLSLG
jgi:hypothetical protein